MQGAMIAPYDPHGCSAVVPAGGGGVIFRGAGGEKSLGDFNVLGGRARAGWVPVREFRKLVLSCGVGSVVCLPFSLSGGKWSWLFFGEQLAGCLRGAG